MRLSRFFTTTYRIFFVSLICLGMLYSCNSGQSTSVKNVDTHASEKNLFRLKNPEPDQFFAFSDSVPFELTTTNSFPIDSVSLFLEGKLRHTESIAPQSFRLAGIFEKTGRQTLRMKIFYNDSLSHSLSIPLIVLSNEAPKQLSYKLVRKLSHDPGDFTQGLFYYKGFLYEGTGRPGHSRLIKTRPENGDVIIERKLEDKFFGEGITRVEDKIYQLTYQHKVGFVYDLETFEQIREFDLQTLEGWGLCYDGQNLIMSDGSSRLYFYDPTSFVQNYQLDVAHDRGLVNSLNELEYVDGNIWANVYGKTSLLKIDAATGIVLAELDLSALYPKGIPRDFDHVLNGIAWNPDHQTYYVTGKLWPVMFEIEILE